MFLFLFIFFYVLLVLLSLYCYFRNLAFVRRCTLVLVLLYSSVCALWSACTFSLALLYSSWCHRFHVFVLLTPIYSYAWTCNIPWRSCLFSVWYSWGLLLFSNPCLWFSCTFSLAFLYSWLCPRIHVFVLLTPIYSYFWTRALALALMSSFLLVLFTHAASFVFLSSFQCCHTLDTFLSPCSCLLTLDTFLLIFLFSYFYARAQVVSK